MIIETGHVVEVTTADLGAALTTDHAAAVTTLTLVDVGDYNTTGTASYLSPADDETEVVIAYTGKDDAAGTLTLAAGLPDALDADTFISVRPASRVKVAQVRFDDESRTIPATVHHSLRDRLPEGVREMGEEEAVEVQVDASGDAVVTDIFDETGVIISEAVVDSPSVGVYLGAGSGIVVPSGVWTRVTGWSIAGGTSRHVRVAPSDGLLEVTVTGRYIIVGNEAWEADASGGRRGRIVLVEPDDTEVVLRQTFGSPEPGGASEFQVTTSRVLTAGQRIGFDVRHSVSGIGATLDIVGDDEGTATALELTHIAIA